MERLLKDEGKKKSKKPVFQCNKGRKQEGMERLL